MKKALVTGSAGLIGSESVRFLVDRGYTVFGIDNNMRRYFFGNEASVESNNNRLKNEYKNYYWHFAYDIRDRQKVEDLFKNNQFDIIIHTAAQPSHDWAAKEPLTDFSINAEGTLLLLESLRHYNPQATFIYTSTNKVYGDAPNYLPLVEFDTRYEVASDHKYFRNGIDESMSVDQTKHSIFGVSKLAADVMVQEYGKYFGLRTGVFRGGCITGPAHSGAELHGFLSYLMKCILIDKPYNILGYKGKQVRDNIHAFDLVNMFWYFHQNPKSGEVYNVGGGRHSNISILEAIAKIERLTGKKVKYHYQDVPRVGDHIWYISDVSKFKSHYPEWDYKYNLDQILEEIYRGAHFF